jgi:hypothetical protein
MADANPEEDEVMVNANPDDAGFPETQEADCPVSSSEMYIGSDDSAPVAQYAGTNCSSDQESDAGTAYYSDSDSEFDGWKTYDELREMKAKQQDEIGLEDQLKELEEMLDREEYAEFWDGREFFGICYIKMI